jgi:hypothetical protein
MDVFIAKWKPMTYKEKQIILYQTHPVILQELQRTYEQLWQKVEIQKEAQVRLLHRNLTKHNFI